MKKLFFALVLAALVAAPATADNAWGNYHWERSSNPVQLTLGDNFDNPEWMSYYTTAIADWNQSQVLDLTAVPGGTKSRSCKPATGTIEVCSDTYGNNGWLGLAGISVSGDHIVSAYSKMNDTYYCNGCSYDTPAWRALVMCQEIGHDFGLDHQDEDFNNPNLGTCMDYTSNPESNQHPNQHDYQQLADIYAHLDSGGGGGGCKGKNCALGSAVSHAAALSGLDLDDAMAWGELVGRSADGHQDIYKLCVGRDANGNELCRITHVLWKDGFETSIHED